MTIKTPASLKSFFEAGDRPSQAEFVDLVDSTYSGEIGAALVSAAAAGSTGLLQVDSASAVSFLTTGTAGAALLSANTPASARTILSAASAGDAIFQIGTIASVRTFIDVTAAATDKAGLIEIATTAEATAGSDTTRAITPATLAIASPEVWVKLGTATASASATISFTWTGTYRKVVIIGSNIIPATDAVAALLRTSANAGSSYDSGASDYGHAHTDFNTTGNGLITDPADTSILLMTTGATHGAGTSTDEQMSFTAEILNPSAAKFTQVKIDGGYRRANAEYAQISAWGQRLSAAVVNGVQFSFDSGNIASGEFVAYGIL